MVSVSPGLEDDLAAVLDDREAAAAMVRGWRERTAGVVPFLRRRYEGRARPLVLLAFDADHIHDFVFASSKPLEIQGASALVEDLTRPARGGSPPAGSIYGMLSGAAGRVHVVFAGGGSGLLMLPAARAAGVAAALQTGIAAASGGGSCTVVAEPFFPHELLAGPDLVDELRARPLPAGLEWPAAGGDAPIAFGEVVHLLGDRLRAAKDARADAPPSLPGFLHRCESCGRRAATTQDPRREDWLCSGCWQHRERGRDERQKLPRELLTAVTLEAIAGPGGANVEDGRAAAGPRGRLALVYADANGTGGLLRQIGDPGAYRAFSTTLLEAIRQARRGLIEQLGLAGRYQAPVVGGDDLLFVVPAANGPELAASIPGAVRDEIGLLQPGGRVGELLRNLTFGVGLLVVPAHYPISFGATYVQALLDSAKTARRQAGGTLGGQGDWVDFLLLTDGSPLSQSPERLRKSLLVRELPARWKLTLTDRPYPLFEFEGQLRARAAALRKAGLARQQLELIASVLQNQSPREAALFVRYQWARSRDGDWARFFGEAGIDPQTWLDDFVLMRRGRSNEYRSRFLDLIELLEMEVR